MKLKENLQKQKIKEVNERSVIPQYVATFLADTLCLTYGLVMGWPATAIPILQSEDSPLSSGPMTSEEASWLASILCITAVLGTPFHIYCCNRFGRKFTGYCTAIPFIISNFLVIYATSVPMLYLSRAILGVSACGTFIFCPLYVSEIAEDKIRGTLGVILKLLRNVGVFFAYVMGSYLPLDTVSWIYMAPCLVFLLFFSWLPETPIYLLRNDKDEEASKALQWLRGKHSDIAEELTNMKISLKAMGSESSGSASYCDLFSSKGTIRGSVIALTMYLNQQLCGFFGIISYTVIIFQESGSNLSPNTSTIIVGFMLVFGTILSSIFCDRAGRKVLLIVSDILMAVPLFVLGIYFYFKEQGYNMTSFGWLPVICLSVYVIANNVGLATLPIVIVTEIFSPKLRSIVLSIVGPMSWILNFFVAKFYQDLCDVIGIHGCYWFFGGWCVAGMIIIAITLPETKGRSSESIVKEFETESFFVQLRSHHKQYTTSPDQVKYLNISTISVRHLNTEQ